MLVAGQVGEITGKTTGQQQEELDRVLVAGLIVEVILDQATWPDSRPIRREEVKRRLQDYLVQYLAGHISLDRFRRLVQNLDGWFEYYFSLLAAKEQSDRSEESAVVYRLPDAGPVYCVSEARAAWPDRVAPAPPSAMVGRQACLEELLESWLAEAKTDMPQRRHRKLTPDKLRSFLCQSGGRWFRLRDFERFVQMDRKTAWDYLQQFLQAGLLCHNRKQSAAVRYCLAPSFLKVEADALRLAINLCLLAEPEDLREKIGDFLVATGGEPFSPAEWDQEFAQSPSQGLLDTLVAGEILINRRLVTGTTLLQLHPRWLQKVEAAKQARPCVSVSHPAALGGQNRPC